LDDHMRISHSTMKRKNKREHDGLYYCPDCTHTTKSRQGMTKHRVKEHLNKEEEK